MMMPRSTTLRRQSQACDHVRVPARTRHWLRGILSTAVAALALHSPAQGQSYPERTVRIINPFPAGGSGDAVLRVVFEKVGAALGQSFVAEARTGAAGSKAAADAQNAKPRIGRRRGLN